MRYRLLLIVAVLLATSLASRGAENPTRPLPQAHAHNDYEHARPLLDALDHGFCSVEADIWLVDGQLLIGHDRKDLKPGRTLEQLYLDPLRQRVRDGGGAVYPGGPTFYLLIDVKTEAEATYLALEKVLARYWDILSMTRNGKFMPKAVTAILSGNRAIDMIRTKTTLYVGIDGRPENLDSDVSPELFSWISANWTLLFRWNGEGQFPSAEKQKLAELVSRAHQQHRRIRFWATPEKETVWRELLAAGVDLINTDKLDELQKFILAESK